MKDVLMKWRPSIRHIRDGQEYELQVNVEVVRYQPNIDHFFSITCFEYPIINGFLAEMDGTCHAGCDHDHIGKFFPELVPYFDLHLKSRFGNADLFDSSVKKISDPFYTEEDKQIIYKVERRVNLRRYLHARELMELIRRKSQQP